MSMTATAIRTAFINYFSNEPRNHQPIPAARLVPENDPTTLFTSSGMQQLVPYLKGETHSMGTRLVNSQPCFRAEDIDEVGDNRHTTFFEMLGNWSLGDYFKEEQLPWFFEFLTTEIGLDARRLYVTVFAGNDQVPQDAVAISAWQKIFNISTPAREGIQGFDPNIKIYLYPATKNWWSRAGVPENMPAGEIGGPDSEVFYDFDPDGSKKIHQQSTYANQACHPNCDCGRFMEIGNSVFMQYIKQADGTFQELPKQNVDFGGGLERIAAATNDDPDVFKIDVLYPLIQVIEQSTKQSYDDSQNQPAMRVIADHMRAATFLIAQGVFPSNKMQGYFLRRLLRRSLVKLQSLKPDIDLASDTTLSTLTVSVITIFQDTYLNSADHKAIAATIIDEQTRFAKTLSKGLKIIQSASADSITGKFAFDLYQTYGFPLEITEELVKEQGITIDNQAFREEFKKHQDISRAGSQALFKGGLADHSEIIIKYHTTTHLLHTALRQVLGDHVQQMGSNITASRLRFDFKHPEKVTPDQLTAIEKHINDAIESRLPVHKTIEPKDQALKSGALAFFRDKYPDTVSVYTIGQNPEKDWHSKELCGGPHVSNTGDIGPMKIVKEEAVGAGIRRIYIQAKNEKSST